MTLTDPQLMADAHSLPVFATAISQAFLDLIHARNRQLSDYEKLNDYFHKNLPKMEAIIANLKAGLGTNVG